MGKGKSLISEQTFFVIMFIFMLAISIYNGSRSDDNFKNAQIKPDTNGNTDTTHGRNLPIVKPNK